eukprot:gene18954-19293_t
MQLHHIHLQDEAGTAALGAALAAALVPGLAIYLHGRVKSPTYTLAEPYVVRLAERMVTVIHFDLYRMVSPEEFLEAGFREHFNENNVCIIEWPEKGEAVLPAPDIHIHLTVAGHGRDTRRTILKAGGVLFVAVLTPLPARASQILAVRVWPSEDYTRVTLENDSNLKITNFIVKNPDRLVVDIEGIDLNSTLKDLVAKI